MTIRFALAAAVLAASAVVPALAMEGVVRPRHAIGYYFGAQPQPQQPAAAAATVRVAPERDRAQAAAAQNFFPVDTTIRSSSR
jgi:hypothetical protein